MKERRESFAGSAPVRAGGINDGSRRSPAAEPKTPHRQKARGVVASDHDQAAAGDDGAQAARARVANSPWSSRATRAASSAVSASVRSVSGARTGPESRPITRMPALMIETA